MKPLKTLKDKKLKIKKETLRALTDSETIRAVGGGFVGRGGSQWCSSLGDGKCFYNYKTDGTAC